MNALRKFWSLLRRFGLLFYYVSALCGCYVALGTLSALEYIVNAGIVILRKVSDWID